MQTNDSASRLQMRSGRKVGFFMKAMRVMILAVVALTACGPGGEDEQSGDGYATSQRALNEGCEDVNCQQPRAFMNPGNTGGTTALPQDPVPLHTGASARAAQTSGDLIKPR
jgi:hypothetical protein